MFSPRTTSAIKRVSWIIGPDGESKSVEVNLSGGWAEMDDGHTRPVLQLAVSDTQPSAQHSTHPPPTISSCKPMQLRPRPRSGKQEERKNAKSGEVCSKMAWTYDKIMECCGRF